MSTLHPLIYFIVSALMLVGAFSQLNEIRNIGHELFYKKHYAKKGFTYKQFTKSIYVLWLIEVISIFATGYFAYQYIQAYINL